MKPYTTDRPPDWRRWQKRVVIRHLYVWLKYIFYAVAFVFVVYYFLYLYRLNSSLEEHYTGVVADLEHQNAQLEAELATFRGGEQYEIRKMKITKYAPLDPAAVEGWDYEGDPEITASGSLVIPGRTAAAGPNIPFGTRIYVEGKGWYVVRDRGGLIGADDIDLAAGSKDESLAWGVQQRLVIIDLQNGD